MKNNVIAINRARIIVLAQAAIQACEALIRETGEGASLAVQPPVRPPRAASRKPEAAPQCPDCGGEMVSRSSSRGPFFGCKQYPHCKGTRPGGTGRNVNSSYAPGNSDSDDWGGVQ